MKISEIDDMDATPLYRRIVIDLRQQIESGVLKPGDRIPSTRQLMTHYEVSETVVRFAMVELKALGLVYGQPGRGVYVSDRPETLT